MVNPHATKNKRRSGLSAVASLKARDLHYAWQKAWERGVAESKEANPCALTPLEYIHDKGLEDAFQAGFFGQPLARVPQDDE